MPGGAGAGDQPDQGVGLQVVEVDVVALGCGAGRGDGGVESAGDAGVGLGVDLEVGVTHPADSIDPAPHTTLLLEAGELGDAVVTRQDPTQLAHLPFERLHRHDRSRADDG